MSSFVKNIWADLVEKRLWPLALVLVLALVAVPTLLAKGPADEAVGPDPTAAGAAAAQPGGANAVVALDVNGSGGPRNGATGRNPFEQLFLPKPVPAPAAAQPGADEGNPGKAGGSDGGDTSTGGSGGGSSTPAPKKTKTTFKVNLRFGEAGAMKTIDDVPRLTPLPDREEPFFVFLGIKDGDTLIFLVSADAKATGDGTCKPSKSVCEKMELRAGDTEFFDVSTDQGIRQYQLDVLSIKKITTVSTGAAKKANARVSRAGADLLRDAGSDGLMLGDLRWSPDLGQLVPAAP